MQQGRSCLLCCDIVSFDARMPRHWVLNAATLAILPIFFHFGCHDILCSMLRCRHRILSRSCILFRVQGTNLFVQISRIQSNYSGLGFFFNNIYYIIIIYVFIFMLLPLCIYILLLYFINYYLYTYLLYISISVWIFNYI